MLARRATRLLIIFAIGLLALVLRDAAVRHLPIDFDEPVYFRAGQAFAAAVRAGDLARFTNADTAPEHPALVKLLYAAVFLRYPPAPPLPDDPNAAAPPQVFEMGLAARRASQLFGVLNVLLVAAISPAAGALLAVHSYTVKYTAQVYLEALPMFTATVCVLAYGRASRQDRQEREGRKEDSSWRSSRSWREPLLFWTISAVALGLTAAGKYVYCVAGLAVAADALWRAVRERRPRLLVALAGWGALAVAVFVAANPNLWPDPPGRLLDSLAFHAAYSQSAHVAQSGYPWYQPFVWLVDPQPTRWHPGVIFIGLDPLIALLGAAGAPLLWRRQRVVVLWWLIGLAFTLAWSTKWPQYSLVMTAPMCLSAAEALRWLWARVPADVKATVSG